MTIAFKCFSNQSIIRELFEKKIKFLNDTFPKNLSTKILIYIFKSFLSF